MKHALGRSTNMTVFTNTTNSCTNPAWINMHNSLSEKRDYKASGGL